MRFTIDREKLLPPLQLACGVVGHRQTLPVLSNLLLDLQEDELVITGADQEVQVAARIAGITADVPGAVTVPAHKLMHICRSLPAGAGITLSQDGARVAVDSGRFSSYLATLPGADFPAMDIGDCDASISLAGAELVRLLQRTGFAMAQQDVRYYFNGVLIEVAGDTIRFVATNGQRLACSHIQAVDRGSHQFIIPRKAVAELSRILDDTDAELMRLDFTANHMQASWTGVRLVTKLIDATYPDYSRAIPAGGDKVVMTDRLLLREALLRTAILSNELYHNVRMMLSPGKLGMHASNPRQEEATESLLVDYEGEPLQIGFNVSYLTEALSVMQGDRVRLTFTDAASACLLEDVDEAESLFVISPMVL